MSWYDRYNMDYAAENDLTVSITLHEYRELATKVAFLEGYLGGVLKTIDSIGNTANPGHLYECVRERVCELVDKDKEPEDKEGK